MTNTFLPPANIDDFSKSKNNEELLKKEWHDKMHGIVSKLIEAKDRSGNQMYPRFYSPIDPIQNDDNATIHKKTIPWDGFPLMIENWLNLNDSASKSRWDQGYRSAEMLRENAYIYVEVIRDGVVVQEESGYELNAYNPNSNIAMYPVNGDQVDIANAFPVLERIQDEYLEWHTKKDATGKVTQITFTAEGPEYWDTIADNDPELLTNLYKEYVDERVVEEDLYWQTPIACSKFSYNDNTGQYRHVGFVLIYNKGSYNQSNKWNTELGAMHLIQRNNSLAAEVRLAADATKRYGIRPQKDIEVNRFEFVACGVPAGINRNSDPTISDEVNKLALNDLKVTIGNPIGLYIGDIQVTGIRDGNGNPVERADILKIERQNNDPFSPKILRFKIVLPEGSEEGLENYTLNGFPLKYGGPIAKETSIVIYGEAMSSTTENPVVECRGKACYHPEKPSFIVVTGINNNCADIDYDRITAPFKVAEIEPEIVNNNIFASVLLDEQPNMKFRNANLRGIHNV